MKSTSARVYANLTTLRIYAAIVTNVSFSPTIGMEVGPSYGDPFQGNSLGIDGRRTAREDCGVRATGTLRQSLSHQRFRPGTGSLSRKFYHESR